MSLKIFEGINNTTIITNENNHAVDSIKKAFDLFTTQKQHAKRTLIIDTNAEIPSVIFFMIKSAEVNRVIFIGEKLHHIPVSELVEIKTFPNLKKFKLGIAEGVIQNETILITSDQHAFLDEISTVINKKSHKTKLEIYLDAFEHNLSYFKSKIKADTKMMVMLKSYAYGNGCGELANYLQSLNVDYFGVAYIDEGIALRRAGITNPILVLNSSTENIELLLQYKLEPEIYNFNILEKYAELIRSTDLEIMPIHIKLETGMNRLGFREDQLDELVMKLKSYTSIKIKGIMSHMPVSSDNTDIENEFTKKQIKKFDRLSNLLIEKTGSRSVIRHLCNSAGTERYPEAHFDMVRVGIGSYGISAIDNSNLQQVSCLKAHISKINDVPANETIGYSLKGKINRDSRIGIVTIGYGDGYNRLLSNGTGQVIVRGKKVPIVGNICMDVTMVDLTDVPQAQEGDEVIVFGPEHPVSILAEQINTIPYEILTSTARRVNYVYIKQ